jgi:hypothetical protein
MGINFGFVVQDNSLDNKEVYKGMKWV